jgi:hypothetical protein
MRDATPFIETLHSSILACIADTTVNAATRAEQAAKMEEVASARWVLVMEMQDIKLDLIKANIVAKKRREDLAILIVNASGMDDDIKAWCAAHRATILASRESSSTCAQPSTATPATATTPPAPNPSPSTATPPSPTTPTIVPDSPVEEIA